MSKLEVRVTRRGDFGLVEVEDDGPGIPPSDWAHVTQRFVSSKSGEGSSGLGFAIASEVAGALKGALSFREKNAGTRLYRGARAAVDAKGKAMTVRRIVKSTLCLGAGLLATSLQALALEGEQTVFPSIARNRRVSSSKARRTSMQ